MENLEFKRKLERRTLRFAIAILKMASSLPRKTEWMVICNQVSKSGTSIGANYREANHAKSFADFKHKISICESEASETVYWLEIIKELGNNNEMINKLYNEATELMLLFISIGKKLKK